MHQLLIGISCIMACKSLVRSHDLPSSLRLTIRGPNVCTHGNHTCHSTSNFNNKSGTFTTGIVGRKSEHPHMLHPSRRTHSAMIVISLKMITQITSNVINGEEAAQLVNPPWLCTMSQSNKKKRSVLPNNSPLDNHAGGLRSDGSGGESHRRARAEARPHLPGGLHAVAEGMSGGKGGRTGGRQPGSEAC